MDFYGGSIGSVSNLFHKKVETRLENMLNIEINNLVSDDKIISIWCQDKLLSWTFLEGNSSKIITLGQVSNPHQIIVKEET